MAKSHEFPDVNIDFKYSGQRYKDVLHYCNKYLEKRKAIQVDSLYDVFLIEFGGREIFFDKENNDLIYPEELSAIYFASNVYDEIDEEDIIKQFKHEFDTLRMLMRYHKIHKDDINIKNLFY